ncbi:hypothetical protein QLX08_002252 [Tetragonisca angustula]|uniref:Uncharacterized protein n=1 Tax=Tetragonisca angustula TaxID=166442 RepID=A0AAW1AE98_9HYME
MERKKREEEAMDGSTRVSTLECQGVANLARCSRYQKPGVVNRIKVCGLRNSGVDIATKCLEISLLHSPPITPYPAETVPCNRLASSRSSPLSSSTRVFDFQMAASYSRYSTL